MAVVPIIARTELRPTRGVGGRATLKFPQSGRFQLTARIRGQYGTEASRTISEPGRRGVLVRILTLAIVALTAGIAIAVPFPPPPNDECTSATVVDTVPYVTLLDTTLATPSYTDDFYM